MPFKEPYCYNCQDVVDIKSWTTHKQKVHDCKCVYEGCGAKLITKNALWQHMIKKHEGGTIVISIDEKMEGNKLGLQLGQAQYKLELDCA